MQLIQTLRKKAKKFDSCKQDRWSQKHKGLPRCICLHQVVYPWLGILERSQTLLAYSLQISVMLQALTCKSWSTSTSATIASTIGTALGTTQGSCLPLASRFTSSPPRLTVFWFLAMVEVGLKATLMTIFSPFDRPPCTPPDLQSTSF